MRDLTKGNIYIYRETVLASWLRDIGTFAAIAAAFWVNHRFIGGNNWLDFLLTLAAVVGISTMCLRGNNSKRFKRAEDAIAYLQTSPPATPEHGD